MEERAPDGGELDSREHHRGHIVVIQLIVLVLLPTKQPITQTTTRRDCHRREEHLASNVAEGIDVLDVGLLVLVDDDIALLVEVEANDVRLELLGIGMSADRP